MLTTLLNHSYLYLVPALMFLLIAGLVTSLELYYSIYPASVTSASDRVAEACHRIVLLAAVAYCVIAILQALTGGDINAL